MLVSIVVLSMLGLGICNARFVLEHFEVGLGICKPRFVVWLFELGSGIYSLGFVERLFELGLGMCNARSTMINRSPVYGLHYFVFPFGPLKMQGVGLLDFTLGCPTIV